MTTNSTLVSMIKHIHPEQDTSGVCLVDSTNCIKYVNTHVKNIFEAIGSAIIGTNITEFVASEHKDRLSTVLNNIRQNRKGVTDLQLKWDHRLSLSETISIFPDVGNNGVLVLLLPLNDKIIATADADSSPELDEVRKLNSLQNEIIRNISHEIRTPLTGILGITSLLIDRAGKKFSDENIDLVENLHRNNYRLINTVDRIICLAELESGTFNGHPVEIDLYELLQEILNSDRNSIKEWKTPIRFSSDKDIPKIRADKTTLIHALTALIDNAAKFTREGEVKLSLANKKTNLSITISDTGIGMSEDFIQMVYEPFSQESFGLNREFQGLGIGMTLARKCLEYNNIKIDVSSHKKWGTVIELSLNYSAHNSTFSSEKCDN
ncbi:MAG: HAMP domain-containing histidine kinase [Candidatus Marinimicrobia bacterium]|nr:HAMP domain-containing histidine kinase [Candidatus Neomarinimicrobiota bacterium]MCF7922357.1 HAMP domain-containing histidine kinase [Candidatus Neomarinimicrobiota bacterium]